MAQINNFENYCIYREFLDPETFLIIVYDNTVKKFYQKILTADQWHNTTSNFSLEELEEIFKVCINMRKGYTLKIFHEESGNRDKNLLYLSFCCKELIKTYKWQFLLCEKNYEEYEKLNNLFHNIDGQFYENSFIKPNIISQKEFTDTDIMSDNEKINEKISENILINYDLYNITKEKIINLFICQKKEISMISCIAKLNNPQNITKNAKKKLRTPCSKKNKDTVLSSNEFLDNKNNINTHSNQKYNSYKIIKIDDLTESDTDTQSDTDTESDTCANSDLKIIADPISEIEIDFEPNLQLNTKSKSMSKNQHLKESHFLKSKNQKQKIFSEVDSQIDSRDDKYIKNKIRELKKNTPGLYETQYLQMAINEKNEHSQ